MHAKEKKEITTLIQDCSRLSATRFLFLRIEKKMNAWMISERIEYIVQSYCFGRVGKSVVLSKSGVL
jgi:hypothetical protein